MSDRIDWAAFWSVPANRRRSAADIAQELDVRIHRVRCAASRHRISLRYERKGRKAGLWSMQAQHQADAR